MTFWKKQSSVFIVASSLLVVLSGCGVAAKSAQVLGQCDYGCESDDDCDTTRGLKCYSPGSSTYRAVKTACKVRSKAMGTENICYSTSGVGGGDPHFSMYDGTKYSFHGQCDLIMARSRSSTESSAWGTGSVEGGLDLHARTTLAGDGSWSLISAVAVRIGDDILEFNNDGSHYLNSIQDPPLPAKMNDRYIVQKIKSFVELPDRLTGKSKVEEKTILKVQFEKNDGKASGIVLSLWKNMIAVSVDVMLVDTVGMLGTAGKTGMIGRDESKDIFKDANEMGMQWQVRDDEPMLFQTVQLPQYPQECTMPVTVQSRRLLRGNDSNENDDFMRARAIMVCANITNEGMRPFCIDDVIRTGDTEVALVYEDGEGYGF